MSKRSTVAFAYALPVTEKPKGELLISTFVAFAAACMVGVAVAGNGAKNTWEFEYAVGLWGDLRKAICMPPPAFRT